MKCDLEYLYMSRGIFVVPLVSQTVVGKITIPPKDVHVLIPGTCESIR